MVIKSKKIWMNGNFVNWEDANVHVLTYTLHYGLGVFEGVRCYKTQDGRSAIFRLNDHIHRLFNGSKMLLMKMPFSEDEIKRACVETVSINGLEECYLRPLAYSSDGEMGLFAQNPTKVSIAAWPWKTYLGEAALENGVRVKVSSFNRHHVNVGMVHGKVCGHYVNSIIAKREALRAGYDEALMLDTYGYVAEASAENIFMVTDGKLITPPLSCPILGGITRDSIIQIAKDLNVPVVEERFTRDNLYVCDELFFTGTAAELVPVREIDDHPVGDGKPGPLTKKLQRMYFDSVRGKESKYREWLTYVG